MPNTKSEPNVQGENKGNTRFRGEQQENHTTGENCDQQEWSGRMIKFFADGNNANPSENKMKRLNEYRAEMRLSLQEYFLGDKPGGVRGFRARETQQTPPLSGLPPKYNRSRPRLYNGFG